MKPESPSQKQEGEEPKVRLEGCLHTVQRMREWIDEGACPICLTAAAGTHRERLSEKEENEQAYERILGKRSYQEIADEIARFREQLDAAVRENERLRLPPNETLSEYPGCGYCMEAGTPVRPGQVCPRCNDRLPTLNEYWLRRLTGELAKLFPSLGNPVLLEYCPEDKWDETISKLRLAAESELEAVRKRTIEECARVCEGRAGSGPYAESMGAFRVLISAADAIRSLPLTGSGEK